MNHAFDYCRTPARVTKRELVNALNAAMHQLQANGARVEVNGLVLDNAHSIGVAKAIMFKAGHIAFTK